MIAIFPGVYTKIKDESFFIQLLPSTIGFLPFFSEKGPDNKLMLVADTEALIKTFGEPNRRKYGQGLYVAYQFLSNRGSLYAMRLLPNDAAFANVGIQVNPVRNNENNIIGYRLEATSMVDINSLTELTTNADLQNFFVVFYPIGRGAYYNNIAIRLTPSANIRNAYILDIYEKIGNDTLLRESFEVAFTDMKDPSGEQMRIDFVLENYSKYLRCYLRDSLYSVVTGNNIVGNTTLSDIFASITDLRNGSDGTGLYDASGAININGQVATQLLTRAYTGLIDEAVIDTEFVYFSLVFDAGYPTPVKFAIRQLCEDIRGDCVGILDNGDSASAEIALNKRVSGDTYPFNSFYVALYECYSEIVDNFTGQYIWITPVYHMARIIPQTDFNYELWFPPAGLTRGVVYARKLRYNLKGSFKDQFKLNQLNPIMQFKQGFTVWGQWTTFRKPSALQSLHIVRLVLWIKRILEENLRWFIWELNSPETRETIKKSVDEFLSYVKNRGALEEYNINVYSTEYDKKRGVVNVDVYLKPVRAIEIIMVSLIIQ